MDEKGNDDRAMKTGDVAKMLSVSIGTVKNLVRRGLLRRHKYGKAVRFLKPEVVEFMKGGCDGKLG